MSAEPRTRLRLYSSLLACVPPISSNCSQALLRLSPCTLSVALGQASTHRRHSNMGPVSGPINNVRIYSLINAHTCRSLSASSTFFRYKTSYLLQFTLLTTLELDFAGDGLATQNTRATLLFKNIAAELTRMKLTHLPRIDTALLSLIASRFASLNVLELSCTERLDEQCCWLCFEESSTCTSHSPIPDLFVDVEHLAVRPTDILLLNTRRLIQC